MNRRRTPGLHGSGSEPPARHRSAQPGGPTEIRLAQPCRVAACVATGARRGGAERRRSRDRDDRPRRRPGRSVRERGAGTRCRLDVVGAARTQRPAAGQLLTQGLHPGHPFVPRYLPLLHVRHRAGQAARPGHGHVHGARRDPRRRPPRRRIGLQGSTFHARRSTGDAVGGSPAVAGRTRLRLDAGLRAGDGDPGARGNRAAAAPEPRGDELVGAVAAQAGGPVDGDDAGDHLAAAVRDQGAGPLRQSRQGPRRAAAHPGRRRPAVDAVHHWAAGRYRRDSDRARRDHACDPPLA